MRRKHFAVVLVALPSVLQASGAMGGSTSVGTTITFDREATDLGEPKDIKLEFNASHTFDNEVVLGASVDYSNAASSDSATDNLEGTAGYRLRIHNAVLVIGSAGIGERFQTSGSGNDFPYYVFRVATDLVVSKIVTWNAVGFRYRDAFDSSNDYLTPQLGTGLTFKVGQHGSIAGKVEYNWKDWNPDSVGFSLGYKHAF